MSRSRALGSSCRPGLGLCFGAVRELRFPPGPFISVVARDIGVVVWSRDLLVPRVTDSSLHGVSHARGRNHRGRIHIEKIVDGEDAGLLQVHSQVPL